MPKRTVIDTELVTMWFHPRTKIVHHRFHKFVWGDAFVGALNKGVEVLREEGACKWLSDDRNSGARSRSDTDWAMTDWFPRAMKAGWKAWAVVLPADVIGQMNMHRFISEYSKQGLMAQAFSDPVVAMAWLEAAEGL